MRRERRGHTLIEILIVLAIIVMLVGMSVISIRMMYADEHTEAASDLVRAKWAEARSRSLKEGVPYVFGVVWGEDVWRIAPDGPDYWDTGAKDDEKVQTGRLPDGVRFVEEGAPSLVSPLAPSPDPKSVNVDQFTPLVTFYPDGSIEPAAGVDGVVPEVMHVHVEGAATNSRMAVSLRSLTGVTTRTWKHPGQGKGSGRGNDGDADDRR